MLRRAFLRRMAFAALATWFLDLPLPVERGRIIEVTNVVIRFSDGTEYDPRGLLQPT